MAKAATGQRTRAPQGAKRVAQAFFDELETVAEDKQADVAKAAQAMVRETLLARREKAKAAKAKLRAGKATPAKRKTAAETERKPRQAARGRKAPRTQRARSAEPPSDDTQENAESAGES